MKESPIFLKTHDLVVWLLEHTTKFPKSQLFVMASRVEKSSLDFYDLLVAAGKRRGVVQHLHLADIELERLRHHLRLCKDLKLFSIGQYEHAVRQMVAVGKLLGGWLSRATSEKGDRSKGTVR